MIQVSHHSLPKIDPCLTKLEPFYPSTLTVIVYIQDPKNHFSQFHLPLAFLAVGVPTPVSYCKPKGRRQKFR